ncbi:hypothetical protein H6783_03170 [Candidatus Nomurabacteria bacterium]|nr:hypothetical protein [Candidatus Nomurabacteria bacterium]
MKYLFYSLLWFVCIVPLGTSAQAINHKVTPRVIDLAVEPRDIISRTITVENFNHYKLTVYPTVNVVAVDEGGDIIDFTAPAASDNTVTPSSWIEIARGGQELMPGETIEIPLTIHIHPHAVPGVYYVFIGFGTGRNSTIAAEQVEKGIAPGVIVTLAVAQNKKEFLKLDNFIVKRFVFDEQNEAITYTLTNPGEAEIAPTGEIIISDSKGVEVTTLPVNADHSVLTPGQESSFTVSVPTAGLLGRYKAFLTIDYGTEDIASVYDTAYFYVIPWVKLLLLFLFLLVVALLAATLWYRKLHQYHGAIEEDHHELPLFIKEGTSAVKDHDIDLTQKR